MTVEIYNALQSGLSTLKVNNENIFKTVKMFFNEIVDEMDANNKIDPYLKPACLIQFTDIVCNDLGARGSIQQGKYSVVLHMVWDIRKKDDLAIMTAKQQVYAYMQNFMMQSGQPHTGRFLRRSEFFNPEYKTLIVIEQTYSSTFKDFAAQNIPTTGTAANMTTNPIILPHI